VPNVNLLSFKVPPPVSVQPLKVEETVLVTFLFSTNVTVCDLVGVFKVIFVPFVYEL